MITIEQATEILKKNAALKEAVEIDLMASADHILAGDIEAPFDLPAFNNSAMDGYAVRWGDIEAAAGGLPVEVVLTGESQAGFPFAGRLQRGQAIRISTGAAVPDSADAVVPVEDCAPADGERVTILQAKKRHQHIRFKGEEFSKGMIVAKKGVRITPAYVALLASIGIDRVRVAERPAISLCITGSELVDHNNATAFGQVRNSNGPMLESALKRDGARLLNSHHLGDDPEKIKNALASAALLSDLIISTGGVSVGHHDHVRSAAEAAGFETLFWKIRQRPGKPMFAARRGNCLLIGLPGNPVSAFMGYTHYIKPLLGYMQGRPFKRQTIVARMAGGLINRSERVQLNRVVLEQKEGELLPTARLLSRQGSHMPTTVAHADGYIRIKINQQIEAGEQVAVFLF